MNNSRTNNSLSENISKSFIQETQPLDIIKGYRDSSAILEKLEENLEKGLISDEEFEKALSTLDVISKGGEGSRGGKIIGHTKSGKPIYDQASHAAHVDFTAKDHEDAVNAHVMMHPSDIAKNKAEGHYVNHDLQIRNHVEKKKEFNAKGSESPVSQRSEHHKELVKIKSAKDISNMSNSKAQKTIASLKKSGHLSEKDSKELDEHAAQDNDDAFSNKLHESVKKYQEAHK